MEFDHLDTDINQTKEYFPDALKLHNAFQTKHDVILSNNAIVFDANLCFTHFRYKFLENS